jgi:hypothetical protein
MLRFACRAAWLCVRCFPFGCTALAWWEAPFCGPGEPAAAAASAQSTAQHGHKMTDIHHYGGSPTATRHQARRSLRLAPRPLAYSLTRPYLPHSFVRMTGRVLLARPYPQSLQPLEREREHLQGAAVVRPHPALGQPHPALGHSGCAAGVLRVMRSLQSPTSAAVGPRPCPVYGVLLLCCMLLVSC